MQFGGVGINDWLSPPGAVLTTVETFGFQRAGDIASDAHSYLAAGG